jgi:hypothetical protein
VSIALSKGSSHFGGVPLSEVTVSRFIRNVELAFYGINYVELQVQTVVPTDRIASRFGSQERGKKRNACKRQATWK